MVGVKKAMLKLGKEYLKYYVCISSFEVISEGLTRYSLMNSQFK